MRTWHWVNKVEGQGQKDYFCEKKGFCSLSWDLENCLSQSFHISHSNWSCLLILYADGQRSRSQWLICKKEDSAYFLRTFYHRAFIRYTLIGHSEDKTPFDSGFTRWQVKGQCHKGHYLKKYKLGFCSLSWELFITKLHISHADWSWWGHMSWCF